MTRTLCILLATLAFVQTTNVASAQNVGAEISAEERERDARALFSLASRHYETGRLAEAIEEFARAYELFPLPALQFNLYLAYRDSGDVAGSTSSLRLYLETEETMDPERRASLERRLATLEARGVAELRPADVETAPLEGEPDADQDLLSEPVDSVEPVEPVDSVAAESSGLSPLVGGVFLGVGAAMLVGALAEGLVANGKNSELDDVCNDAGRCERDEQEAIVSSFETHRNVAWGLLYAGAAVAVTGTVLLLLSGGDASDEGARGDLSCDPQGCVGSVRVRF